MDLSSMLTVRFHFNGRFINFGKTVQYVGGREEMSYIDRDKVSLPEIVGHLRDHYMVEDGALLHWLYPGKSLGDGLRVLVDDSACLQMSEATVEGGIADIYVEATITVDESNADIHEEINQSLDCEDVDVGREEEQGKAAQVNKGKWKVEDEHSSSDSDYMAGDDSGSEADDEATDILNKFKDFKKKLKRGQIASLDDVVLEGSTAMAAGFEGVQDDGNETPYADSSEEEESIDELDTDGQLTRKENNCLRYKKTTGTPVFALGMKFRSKKQFKKAIIKYGLAERKVINFVKDEAKRVRAKCDWAVCPWVCLLSNNSRSQSWQIVTFNNYHTCPPRRDNRLVTARRIAEKYEKFIMANPTWKFASMKQTVLEEMFADVSISKLKRAKGMVMQKALDATKGQYQMVYDYQLELLRSNPGSTIIVSKEKDVEPPTFQRMYICLDALKKGFLAGCRKLVGLDGCFFKGATNGELLCAIGRDANNQMYPIAWAVVARQFLFNFVMVTMQSATESY